jgi:hypothetical protein
MVVRGIRWQNTNSVAEVLISKLNKSIWQFLRGNTVAPALLIRGSPYKKFNRYSTTAAGAHLVSSMGCSSERSTYVCVTEPPAAPPPLPSAHNRCSAQCVCEVMFAQS